MKTSSNNNNIERLRKITFIICVPFYACTYKEKGTKRAEKGYLNRDKFFAEIVSILQADGWTLTTMGETLDCGKSTCPELTKGNEHIYCHPEELTGEVQDEKAFAEILKGAASFRIVKKEAGDIYVCADNDEGKQLYRDTYRDCIDEVIRDVVYLKTNIYGGLKGDWIDLDSATRIIGERVFIATKSNNDEYNSVTVLREYVTEQLCRLQDAGRIEATTNKHGQTVIKWPDERTLAYNARCKELEAEALAQMPYKVGDTVKSRDGVAGRVVEMHPEVTGDTDSPHLIYEYDGKPTVNVVILDADGKRHCAHWSFFTLQEASEITDVTFFTKGKKYRCIKSVVMKKGGETAFKAGSTYEQVCEPTHLVGWLRNEQGERHGWPQPVYIADEVKTWGTKPEDIDPRLYFEPVENVKETYKTGLLVTDKKFGLDYERITGIEEGMNTYIVTTATKIQVECMKHYRVMEKAKNEHTVADLPEWVRPGAVLMINGTWKWEEVVIVELADGCVWYKKGNSVMGWTYDHFISLYVNHHYAKVKEYAPEPTLEDIGKFRAVCEAEGCTYPGDVEGTSEYYRDALLAAAEGQTVSYQFGNCRFDCKRNESGTWDVHAYDTDGEDTTFEGRTASFFGGMFNDLFGTWGSGNLPDPDGGNKTNYVLEYQRLGHQEARPQEWLKKTTNEKREAYYRACVELERMAGDGLPLVIRADSADLSVNPWNALDKRVKTARVFHLGDRVKVKDGNSEVTGIVNGIRCNEGSLALGGWCTHYNIQWDKQYQYTTGYGTATGCGNIGPERIELIERAEFCPEPTADWLQPGEKVAHYLDYGDGTGDWLIGNVTGYELCDDGTVIVIYGEYRTPLKGMVKYQPEMDGKAA